MRVLTLCFSYVLLMSFDIQIPNLIQVMIFSFMISVKTSLSTYAHENILLN